VSVNTTLRATADLDGEVLRFEFSPEAFLGEDVQALSARIDGTDDLAEMEALECRALGRLITAWDLTGADGQRVPINEETIRTQLPADSFPSIIEAMRGAVQEWGRSAEGEVRAPRAARPHRGPKYTPPKKRRKRRS
jgi:hypothetical protein